MKKKDDHYKEKKSNACGGKQLWFSNAHKLFMLFMRGKVFSRYTKKKTPQFFMCVVVTISFQNRFG
jgi:hypothetical protein